MSPTQEAAMRQALDALEQSETTVPYDGFGMAHREAERKHQAAIAALRVALAEQQKPVVDAAIHAAWTAGFVEGEKAALAEPDPPQRKPLSEEEIQAAWDSVDMRHPRGNETRIAFARAVEKAHGIS